jgi:hypothetical protein
MSDKIIWYKTFYNPIEANIIRAKLEDSGFHCFLKDENLSIIQPLYNQAIGGVKLMVFERDIPNIDALLAEDSSIELDDHDSEDQVSLPQEVKVCTNCGSSNVGFGEPTTKKHSWWMILMSLIFTVPAFHVKNCYHCFNCGKEFD